MSEANGAATLRDAPDVTVDDALRAWRNETDRRRSAYQDRARVHNDAQRERRSRFFRALGLAGVGAGCIAAGVALVVGELASPPPAEVAPSFAAFVPTLEADGAVMKPVRVESAAVSARALALASDVRSWSDDGFLWLQFDYRGAPVVLHWKDASGVEVLESTLCDNRLGGGLSRCYVGRTPARVAIAREAGAVAGTWTVDACQDAVCSTVASFSID